MKSRLTWFIVAAMLAGPVLGAMLHASLDPHTAAQASDILALITSAFLRLIKMLIAPLVFCTLTVGVARMGGGAAIARVGARSIAWFLLATSIAMCIGLTLAQSFKPGLQITAALADLPAANGAKLTAREVLEHIVPSSVFQALAGNEILQIVVFALLFGGAASNLGARVAGLIDLIEQASVIVLRMTRYVMSLAPIAVCAALAATVLTEGLGILSSYAKFIALFYSGLAILWLFLGLVLRWTVGRRSLKLIKAVRAPLLLAFSTASSEAAYPQTLKSLEDFGVSPRIAAFVLPLGYSFNLDGAALYCSFATLFIAQIYRIDMNLHQQMAMMLILMITSKGMAGVPRASLMVVAGSLSYFGLPDQGLVFILAVDHLLDMGRTATNLIGNAVAATLVAKWEGELTETVLDA
jgi:Na+/H+-dicarboxylate symporter